jgi:hypothetical protein
MGPVPKAQSSGSARSRRTRGRKGFKGDGPKGKGKGHFPMRTFGAGKHAETKRAAKMG